MVAQTVKCSHCERKLRVIAREGPHIYYACLVCGLNLRHQMERG